MTIAPRILVVDRVPVFAAGVEAAFARMGHPVTLEHLKTLPSLADLPATLPDVLLLEASWGAQAELELIRQLHPRYPQIRCIVSVCDGKAGLAAAVRQAGGSGVFNKALNPQMLVSLCLQVLQEDCFIPTSIGEAGKQEAALGGPSLTARQQEILWLVAEGQSNKQIARRLSVAEGTIKNQLYSMYRVLGVSNRTEASRWWLHTAQ